MSIKCFPEFCDSSYGFIGLEGVLRNPQQSFQVVRRGIQDNSIGESFETSHQENKKDTTDKTHRGPAQDGLGFDRGHLGVH